MAVTVTCSKIIKEGPPHPRVIVQFSDGTGLEFNTRDEVIEAIKEADADTQQARMWLIAWWLKRDPTAATPSMVEGKTLTFNLLAANPIRVI